LLSNQVAGLGEEREAEQNFGITCGRRLRSLLFPIALLTLPARPFQAGPIHAELHEAHHFRLGHVGGAAIFAPETDVRWMRAEHISPASRCIVPSRAMRQT